MAKEIAERAEISERKIRSDFVRLINEKIKARARNFYAFSEFCPAYKTLFDSFEQECKQIKKKACSMAERAIQALDKMDYTKKANYNECAEEIIRVFAWGYYKDGRIYLSFLYKENNKWHWNP